MSNHLPVFRDPWAKFDAWRSHPVFSKRAMLSNFLPGFGIGLFAFTVYVAADELYFKPERALKATQHHDEDHH
ncbi:NADH-ubiquinone oxidoreductase B12 subunit family-domain-containing protein [Schizophyllum commune]